MSCNILVVGVGQLGSRYVQGMVKYPMPLNIWALDTSISSLDRLWLRWNDVADQSCMHTIRTSICMQELPHDFDLAIMATAADVRPELTKQLSSYAKVGNWIFEKILAQSVVAISEISSAVDDSPAWVNTPRHLWSLYRHLRAKFDSKAIVLRVEGLRGIACNAIHFIDLVSRWNHSNVVSVDTSGLNSSWIPAKREGFYEVEGKLKVEFDEGSVLTIDSCDRGRGYYVNISSFNQNWDVVEDQGYATEVRGWRVVGATEHQSYLTSSLILEIFEKGRCNLPNLEQSISQHIPFLSALQLHWEQYGNSSSVLPIT